MRGSACGGEERRRETVDLPVAMLPVRPIRSIGGVGWVRPLPGRRVAWGERQEGVLMLTIVDDGRRKDGYWG